MKTMRAFLWGSALGALVGLILAPQRDSIAQTQLAEEQQGNPAAEREPQATPATSTAVGAQAAPTTPATPTTPTTPAASMATEAQARPASPTASMAQTATAGRRYVGNLNTKIYHEATDTNLPNEENRAYFASPEEAEAAGYRAAQ